MQSQIDFEQPGLTALLADMDEAALDALQFGVIGFDAEDRVRRYNAFESQAAGLRPGACWSRTCSRWWRRA
jgi:hypothetical protein